jgi:hypothetical protein
LFLVATGFHATVAALARIAVDEAFNPMKSDAADVQFRHGRSGAVNRVDLSRCGINSNVAAHSIGEAFCAAGEPLLALGLRVQFGIPHFSFFLGGTGQRCSSTVQSELKRATVSLCALLPKAHKGQVIPRET